MGERGEIWKVEPCNILFLSHTCFPSADSSLEGETSFPCCWGFPEAALFSLQNTNSIHKPHTLTDQMEKFGKQNLFFEQQTDSTIPSPCRGCSSAPLCAGRILHPLIQTQDKHRSFSEKLSFSCISSNFCPSPCPPMPGWQSLVRNRP